MASIINLASFGAWEGLLVDIVSLEGRTPLGIGSVLHVSLAIIGTFEQKTRKVK